YANMYFYRLLEVLKEDFPATLKVVGGANYHNLVTGYLLEYRPTEPSVHSCGRHLAEYLRSHPIVEKFPYLADLAALERALVESFCAPDAAVLDADLMRTVPASRWPAFRIRTHPAATILTLQWRVSDLHHAIGKGTEPQQISPGPVKTIVWRQNSRVFHRDLEGMEEAALATASHGTTLAQICTLIAAAAGDAHAVKETNRLLERWLASGILRRSNAPGRRRTNS
ncbi:MAG TPA: putative DNA-binding domain-containing protein, partial [Candidatus Binataceae bacterium]|nr:putative DNA-binding domain-containing protein [Candidatus Binataceae bacterium]